MLANGLRLVIELRFVKPNPPRSPRVPPEPCASHRRCPTTPHRDTTKAGDVTVPLHQVRDVA